LRNSPGDRIGQVDEIEYGARRHDTARNFAIAYLIVPTKNGKLSSALRGAI